VLAAALPALSACVTHVPLSTAYRGPTDLPVGALVATSTALGAPLVIRGDEQRRPLADMTVRDLVVRSATEPEAATAIQYYDVDGDERTPVVVLLPVFNGHPMIARYFARYFASQGWAAVVVDRDSDPLEALRHPEETIRASFDDYRRVLDWVEGQPELDAGRIGLFGISLGAMDAVILTALDDRVDALVVAMAGGDLPYVLLNTNYRRVVRSVDNFLADEGLTRDSLQARLHERIETDPLALAPYVDAERVLMIVTRTDAIVPFEAQQALRERLGTPETLYLPTGHRPSVFYFPKVRSSAYEFFARQFATARTAVAQR